MPLPKTHVVTHEVEMYFGNTDNKRNVVLALLRVVVEGDGRDNEEKTHVFLSLRIGHPW